ncbi:MAG: hypothetical protein ACK59M_07505 [Pseudomonadota bacterium]|jgi:hypothetical protein
MRIPRLCLVLCTILLVPQLAWADGEGVPKDGERLEASALLAILYRAEKAGMWFEDGYEGGLRYRFSSDGAMTVRSRHVRNQVISGTWRVQEDTGALCTRIEDDPEHCSRVYTLEDGRVFVHVAHLSRKANTFERVPE